MGFGLIRAEAWVTAGNWESYPGNPLFPPPTGGFPCAPSYPSFFTEGSRVYVMMQGIDRNTSEDREYFFEIVMADNIGSAVLFPSQTIGPNQSLVSSNGSTSLTYSSDGGLYLYHDGDSIPVWRSDTQGQSAGFAAMQGYGYLAVFDAGTVARWTSPTYPADSYAIVQNDGNLVIYDTSGEAMWATMTVTGASHLHMDHSLYSNDSLTSPEGNLTLTYQSNGNLVLVQDGVGTIWQSGTSSSPGRAVMQSDGNLVIYNGSDNFVWQAGTGGHPGAFLQLGETNVAIYSGGDLPLSLLWHQPGGPSSLTSLSERTDRANRLTLFERPPTSRVQRTKR